MALIVIDASIVIAVTDDGDALHHAAQRAIETHGNDSMVLPVHAYAGCLVGSARQGRLEVTAERIGRLVSTIAAPSAATAERAAEIRARSRTLSLADAFVLATADELRADVVLTADRSWRGVLPSVRVPDEDNV